jgi:hypothetical protein
LDEAKQVQAAAAIVSSTEVEALKKKLLDKGEEVCHLTSELSSLEQELQLRVKSEEDARKEIDDTYQSNLADLRLKIQAVEREAKESTRLRIHLEDALETEIALCQRHHGSEQSTSQNQAMINLWAGDASLHIPVKDTPQPSGSVAAAVAGPHPSGSVVAVVGPQPSVAGSASPAPVPNPNQPIYMQSHRKLLFLSSTIIACLAILIQYASESAISHSSIRLTRPGWAQHRNEGSQYVQGGTGR